MMIQSNCRILHNSYIIIVLLLEKAELENNKRREKRTNKTRPADDYILTLDYLLHSIHSF